MSDITDPPETHEVTVAGTVVRLTRVRLADVPAGALVSRRPAHQLIEELTGAAYDLATGFSVRSARPLDPHLAGLWVWQAEIGAGGA